METKINKKTNYVTVGRWQCQSKALKVGTSDDEKVKVCLGNAKKHIDLKPPYHY